MSTGTPNRPLGPVVPSHPAKWPGTPTIRGKFITLEPLSMHHQNDLYKDLSGEANAHLFDYTPEAGYYDIETFRTALEQKVYYKDWVFSAIIDAKTKEALGYLCFMNINAEMRSIEIGNVMFSPRMQQSPGGTESVYLLARYAFEELGYRRLEWKCHVLNAKSKRAAERLGFTHEGIFRQHFIIKGRNRDTAWYSILDGEWPSTKQAFESWLADDNFDEAGKQRSFLLDLRKAILDNGSQ